MIDSVLRLLLIFGTPVPILKSWYLDEDWFSVLFGYYLMIAFAASIVYFSEKDRCRRVCFFAYYATFVAFGGMNLSLI